MLTACFLLSGHPQMYKFVLQGNFSCRGIFPTLALSPERVQFHGSASLGCVHPAWRSAIVFHSFNGAYKHLASFSRDVQATAHVLL
jgi:hypothetical protein